MFTKVLVAHDLREGGDEALALGQLLAQATGAKLAVAGVLALGAVPIGFEPAWRRKAEQVAAEVKRVAEAAGAEPEARVAGTPTRGLHTVATETHADLIVVGASHQSGLPQTPVSGDVGLGLLDGSPCAVAVAPKGFHLRPETAITRIVVGCDGSGQTAPALARAAEITAATGAEMTLVAAFQAPSTALRMQQVVDEALEALPEGIPVRTSVVGGEVPVRLVAACDARSLLFLGASGSATFGRVNLGSTSWEILRSAPCPVLIEPRVRTDALAAARAKPEALTVVRGH
jgi:nucleotide-binding universal stress UspA family protein